MINTTSYHDYSFLYFCVFLFYCNIIPPAGGRKYKLGALGAIGEPFANAFGNQRFVFV